MQQLNHKGNPVIVDLDFRFAMISGIDPISPVDKVHIREVIRIFGRVLIRRLDKTYCIDVLLQKDLHDGSPKGMQIHEHFEAFLKECFGASASYKVDDNSVIYKFN